MSAYPADRQTASIPEHLGIIMDGNRRWSQMRGLPPERGWQEGEERLYELTRAAAQAGVETLTVFAFSRENWQRSQTEVQSLMKQLSSAMLRRYQQLLDSGVQVRFIGSRERLDAEVIGRMERLEAATADINAKVQLVVALDYGGRWDLLQAAQTIGRESAAGGLLPEDLGEAQLDSYMQLSDCPPLDLLIRTGGEQRLSNFLLWQVAYAELYFTACLWPDFCLREFQAALDAYALRQRRYGGDL